jgi:hypothetical protein
MDVREPVTTMVVSLVAQIVPVLIGSSVTCNCSDVPDVHQLKLGLVMLPAVLKMRWGSCSKAMARISGIGLLVLGVQMPKVLLGLTDLQVSYRPS